LQLGRFLDIFETQNELLCEVIDPLDKLVSYVNQTTPDLSPPILHQLHLPTIILDNFSRFLFDPFEFLHLLLELLIDVDQVLFLEQTLEAFVLLLLVRVKDGHLLVGFTTDVQQRLWDRLMLRLYPHRVMVHQEGVF
jgi:hypothetical protein